MNATKQLMVEEQISSSNCQKQNQAHITKIDIEEKKVGDDQTNSSDEQSIDILGKQVELLE